VPNKIKACFNGCSFTWGAGFPPDQRELYIYDRLLAKRFDFDRTNIAAAGASNHVIFMNALEALQQQQYDIMFVQWTGLNRLWLSPGPEIWFKISGVDGPGEFQHNTIRMSAQETRQLAHKIYVLNHDYQNTLDLITYCDTLIKLAQGHTRMVYVNGLVPWQKDLVSHSLDQISAYTKYGLLDFDNHSDEKIQRYFNKIQQKFSALDQSKWVNLFDSFQKMQIDQGPEGHHPGIKSHALLADKISQYLHSENIL
jgi:hypothetical protein